MGKARRTMSEAELDSFVQAAKNVRAKAGDDKTYVNRKEMKMLLACGARAVRAHRQTEDSFVLEVEIRGERFVTAGPRAEELCSA